MTTIKIRNSEIEVKGHSGYAEKGNDIVCAGISVLMDATYNYLKATENTVTKKETDGYFSISINVININGENIIKSFAEMVDDLVKQYPKNIERI